MEPLNWNECFKEAIAKASQAAHPLAKGAYLDLAEFYASQAQRSAGISLRLNHSGLRLTAEGLGT